MNWNKLTYRQKSKVVAAGIFVVMVMAYNLAFSKSWQLYKSNELLTEKLIKAKETMEHKDALEQKKVVLNQKLSCFFSDSTSHHELLVGTITSYCSRHGVLLQELPAMSTHGEGDFKLNTYKIVLEGRFAPLLNMIYELEQKNKIGRVSSVCFTLKHDYKIKKDVLSLSFYIQNIQQLSNGKNS